MNSLVGIFISSYLIALSGAIVPGPVLSVTISESMKGNVWVGPLIVLGHGLLELVLIMVLVAGFADVINNPTLLSIVGVAGGLYLLWMSFSMLKNIKEVQIDASGGSDIWGGPVWAGVVTSLVNPYWIMWWATIGLGYVIVSMKYGATGLVIFFAGHILADFSWYSMVSILMCKSKKFLNNNIYKGIYGSCALLLIIFGVIFGIWGMQHLMGYYL